MMKRTIAITLVGAICLLLFAGCQATPEKPAVAGKDLEQMLALATSEQETTGSLEERLDIPKRYEAYLEDTKGKFKVTIDADIILPEADTIPLIRVKAQPFGQSMVDKLIAVLFKEGKLYEASALSEMTKSEIAERLTQLKRQKIELEQQGMKPLNPPASKDEEEPITENNGDSHIDVATTQMNQLDEVIESITAMEKLIKTAPDEKQLVETTGKFESTSDSIEIVHAAQLNPEGGMHSLFVVNNEKQNSYRVEYTNRKDFEPTFGAYYPEELWEDMADEKDRVAADALTFPVIAIEEAQGIAEQFLEQIGVDYLVCERSEKVIGGSNVEYGDGTRSGNLIKAYQFHYVRQISGVPVTYTSAETAIDWGDSVVWSWDYERMTLIVDDSGIAGVSWNAPYNPMDTITDNTTMLPFSKIQDVFEKMIIISNADYTDDLGGDMNITEVRLGLARIWEQNNLTNGLLIPVWDFFGTRTNYYKDDEGQRHSFTQRNTGQTWLTINAIDGTVIDRSVGY